MAFNGSASMNKRPRVEIRNDVDNNHKMKADINHADEPRRKRPENPENCVLLYTIYNAVYPITTEVIHTISAPSGNVLRIVIFKKTGVQAMVEFDNIDSAKRAKESLNGADIYSGCCTLKIEYAKPTKLNVHKNDTESWDYTLPSGKTENISTRPPPLLQEPRFGAGPQPYRPDASRPHPAGPFAGAVNRYDDFHGGGGDYGGDHFIPDRFAGTHGDRFKSDFGREGIMSTPSGRPGAGFRGMPSSVASSPALPSPAPTGSVMMVYGLDTKKLNCDRLFNLFCLYGNVARIKFLKTKEGAAMIQMGDGMAVERCVQHLNNAPMFNSKNRLQLGYSKQPFLSDVTNPFTLPDGSPSFKDFIGNKHNRFINPAMSMKNRIQSPSRILHFFNTPPNITDETLVRLFVDKKIPSPTTIKIFPLKSERSSSGLLEFEDVEGAIEALVMLNHAPIDNPNGKFPYTMKLCFSSSRQVNMNGSSRLQNESGESNEN